jgi:hypothetical protein
VTATWTQPAVKATTKETYAAFWVGLDGDGSDTVEQIGTMAYTIGGSAYYVAWYEMYPDAMKHFRMVVKPGDVMTGAVEWTGATSYRLTLTNQTRGSTFTTTKTSTTAARASAEIIAEAPASGVTGEILPLATFGLAAFSGCAVDGATLAAAAASRVDMVDAGGAVKAVTSALGADAASFTVTDDFTAPTVTAAGLQRSAMTGWKNKAVAVTLTASDGSGGSGAAAISYTLDGGPTQTYGGAFTVSGAASHVVTYWAVDAVGNTGSPTTGYVNIDLSAPSSAPGPLRVRRTVAVRHSVLKVPVTVTDPLPSAGTAQVVIRVVSPTGKTLAKVIRAGVVVNKARTVSLRLPVTLKRGTYAIRTVATDAAGNVQTRAGRAQLTVR